MNGPPVDVETGVELVNCYRLGQRLKKRSEKADYIADQVGRDNILRKL